MHGVFNQDRTAVTSVRIGPNTGGLLTPDNIVSLEDLFATVNSLPDNVRVKPEYCSENGQVELNRILNNIEQVLIDAGAISPRR